MRLLDTAGYLRPSSVLQVFFLKTFYSIICREKLLGNVEKRVLVRLDGTLNDDLNVNWIVRNDYGRPNILRKYNILFIIRDLVVPVE